MGQYLSKEDLLLKLEEYPGLIPVSLDIENEQIIWLDVEKYHFYEGFFHQSLYLFSAFKQSNVTSFTSDFNVLKDAAIVSDSLKPAGFIFHASRCGSTLLAKVLSRSKENLVLSEAGPHNSVWQVFSKNGTVSIDHDPENKLIYKNLLLAMARRRLDSHQRFFIKFTSFNIHFFEFIHSVFSDVPALFLSREIPEILDSLKKRQPDWWESDNLSFLKALIGREMTSEREVVEGFLEKASEQDSKHLTQIDYKMLKSENLSFILDFFKTKPSEKELSLMKTQFLFDSKSDFKLKKFQGSSI